ncbi:hypothetical protein SAMN04487991_2117 [Celeribacter neptunius]|uniref:DUF2946 domain-containing protein n=2 Tax=Celeribacter neptunius TaxID=588602 RepID=A0A1I3R812_9RHOB|nr:hypothetical protein SAMN04487991_2117 [Celeribacter neptunius]
MTRYVPLVISAFLALSLLAGAGMSGLLKTAHVLSRAGQTSIVICGQSGAETITLDANGEPVSSKDTKGCAHCADCSLVPLAALFAFKFKCLNAVRGKPVFITLTILPERSERIWRPSRGPPSQSKV